MRAGSVDAQLAGTGRLKYLAAKEGSRGIEGELAAMKHFDAIIIGTGQGGPPLAARFADAGKTVAIIERRKFGGTCVNTGCIPPKTTGCQRVRDLYCPPGNAHDVDVDEQGDGTAAEQRMYRLIRQPAPSFIASSRSSSDRRGAFSFTL